VLPLLKDLCSISCDKGWFMVTKKSHIALVSLFVASTCLAEATATKTSAGKSSEKAAETAAKPAEKTKPEAKAMTPADAEKASYGIGMRIGSSLKAQNIPIKRSSRQ
jgi:hypothetical protein